MGAHGGPVRIDRGVGGSPRLAELARERNLTLGDTVREADEALRRARFARRAADAIARLRADDTRRGA